jgi:hypothetical protein
MGNNAIVVRLRMDVYSPNLLEGVFCEARMQDPEQTGFGGAPVR